MEEFLDLFFDDLESPNLIKVRLKDLKAPKTARAGFTTMVRRPGSIMRVPCARASDAVWPCAGRHRPRSTACRRNWGTPKQKTRRVPDKIAMLRAALEQKQRLRRGIAYIDPIDLQYNRFDRVPKPTTQAVMFCLMDASASMTEPLKDSAKRFFMLLHVFLTRYYREVHLVFIRHTSTAAEVDEDTFFRWHRDRRDGHLHGAGGDVERREGTLFAGRLEHLCGAGVRRRQLP